MTTDALAIEHDPMDSHGVFQMRGVSKTFGGTQAVKDVDLTVTADSVHSLIGPNGAGKTTCINIVTGFLVPDEGTISLTGAELPFGQPEASRRVGLARTFQHCRVFSDMTCLENVLVGAHIIGARNLARDPGPTTVASTRPRARDLLDWVGLGDKHDSLAGSLALAEQRRLEIARAMAAPAKLLLLDEPTAGMGLEETEEIQSLVQEIAMSLHVSVLLVAHDIHLVMNVSDRVTVLNFGEVIADGTPADVRSNRAVIDAYLGGDW